MVVLTATAYSQSASSIIEQTNRLAARIDSSRSLKQVYHTMQMPGRGGAEGSVTDIFYIDPATSKLVKVVHNQALFYVDTDTYYFDNDALVLTKTVHRNVDDATGDYLSKGSYYFQNGKLVHKKEEDQKIKNPEAYVTTATALLNASR